jgi:hypothetical protein
MWEKHDLARFATFSNKFIFPNLSSQFQANSKLPSGCSTLSQFQGVFFLENFEKKKC